MLAERGFDASTDLWVMGPAASTVPLCFVKTESVRFLREGPPPARSTLRWMMQLIVITIIAAS